MARESLQRELEKYLQYAEKEGRKTLAKNYQQEVILHVDDYTDAPDQEGGWCRENALKKQ